MAADSKKANTTSAKPEEPAAPENEDETSDLESALFKMMRMQYGIVAGGAKGVTEMAQMVETFVDSLAEETELKTSEDWRAMLESAPDALVNAGRKAMERGDTAAQAVVEAYRRYSEAKG